MTTLNATDLGTIGDVDRAWVHVDKLASPDADLELPGAYLKWYDVRRPDATIGEAERERAREFLRQEVADGRLAFKDELGFIVFHLSGDNQFLIVCVWRGINEMWQALYAKSGDGDFRTVADDGGFRPTQCVWELGPTAHERQAWARFLKSDRDYNAKRAYIDDRLDALV